MVRGMFHASAYTSAAVAQYYPHVRVPGEVGIRRVPFVLEPVLLILQTQHLVRQLERFANVVLVDDLGFYVNRLVNRGRVVVTTDLRFVRHVLITGQQRDA